MTWSNIAKKNATKTLQHSPKKIKQVEKQEVKNDYWSDEKYASNFKTVESQIKESYEKIGFDVPMSIYGRPSLLDFTK